MNYQQLASKGRYGDTELYNINRKEAALLRALGGSGTINPNTGLREYSHKWWHPGGTIGGWIDSAVDAGSDLWNETLGNEGIGGWLTGSLDEPGGSLIKDYTNMFTGGLTGGLGTYGDMAGGMFGDMSSMFGNVFGVGGNSPQGLVPPGPKPGYPAQPPGYQVPGSTGQNSSIWSQILGPGYTGTSPGWGGFYGTSTQPQPWTGPVNMPSSEPRNPYDRPAPPPTPPTPPPSRPGMQGGI